MGIIIGIITGGVAGWIAGKIMGSHMRMFGSIILGVIGGGVGSYLLSFLGISSDGGFIGNVIVAVVGACVLIGIGRLLFKK